jgi:hypothetical protein
MRFALRATTMLLAAALATAAQAGSIPTEIMLSNGNSRMGDVKFPHRLHFSVGARCATCHGKGAAGRIEAVHMKMKDAHSFCMDCHRAEEKGPTSTCSDCHGERKATAGGATATAER